MIWKHEAYIEVSTDAIIDILADYPPYQLAEMIARAADAASDWDVIKEIHYRLGKELEQLNESE